MIFLVSLISIPVPERVLRPSSTGAFDVSSTAEHARRAMIQQRLSGIL
jgi:hypothetical protein